MWPLSPTLWPQRCAANSSHVPWATSDAAKGYRLTSSKGRKIVFLSAIGLLSVSDLLCGLSTTSTMLYICRGLAGVANGGITSLTMMIVSDTTSLKNRGKYQGILGACVGAGNMIGPFIAAAFVQHSTWRGLFWLVCPLAATCGGIAWWILPDNVPKGAYREGVRKIDFMGLMTGSAAIVLILIPVSGGGTYFEWSSPMVIAMLAVGGACAVAFFVVEYRVAVLPMMPCRFEKGCIRECDVRQANIASVSMFRNPAVAVLLVQNLLFGIVYYSQLYYLPLFFQNALQLSPLVSAALILPIPAAQMTFSIASGQFISRFERYGIVIWAGFFLWTVGAALTTLFTRSFPIAGMAVILACQGAGVGFVSMTSIVWVWRALTLWTQVFQPTLVALQAHCTKAQRAVVISNRNFLRSTGGAVGLAASAVLLQNRLKASLPVGFEYLALSTYSTPNFAGVSLVQKNAVLEAYAKASRSVFIFNVPFMALCLLGCVVVKDRGLQRPDEVVTTNEEPIAATVVQVDGKAPQESVSNDGGFVSETLDDKETR